MLSGGHPLGMVNGSHCRSYYIRRKEKMRVEYFSPLSPYFMSLWLCLLPLLLQLSGDAAAPPHWTSVVVSITDSASFLPLLFLQTSPSEVAPTFKPHHVKQVEWMGAVSLLDLDWTISLTLAGTICQFGHFSRSMGLSLLHSEITWGTLGQIAAGSHRQNFSCHWSRKWPGHQDLEISLSLSHV